MKHLPQQKSYCYLFDRKEMDQEVKTLRAEGNTVTETPQQGYCPVCGKNFILSILNINTNTPWYTAEVSCPQCGAKASAGQFKTEHRKMWWKTYGCLYTILILAAIITAIVRSCS